MNNKFFSLTSAIAILIISIILSVFSACQKKDPTFKIMRFDITPDGKQIVFSRNAAEESSIYISNIDGTNKRLLASMPGMVLNSPTCSLNGKNVLFLASKPHGFGTALWTVDIKDNKLHQLTDSSSYKIEAAYSKDGNGIFFTEAKVFQSYSPIGIKAPHNFDIYYLKLSDSSISKISNLDSYSIYNISDFDTRRLLIGLSGKEGGIFLLNKSDMNLKKISPKNDTLGQAIEYNNPVALNSENIICSVSARLISISLKTNIYSVIMDSGGSHFRHIVFDEANNKIYFIRTDDVNIIQSVNLDGSDLEEINLDF